MNSNTPEMISQISPDPLFVGFATLLFCAFVLLMAFCFALHRWQNAEDNALVLRAANLKLKLEKNALQREADLRRIQNVGLQRQLNELALRDMTEELGARE